MNIFQHVHGRGPLPEHGIHAASARGRNKVCEFSRAFPISHRSGVNAALRFVSAFTLIELILSIAIAAVVLAAIGSVFFSALKLNESASASTGVSIPVDHAISVMKDDLKDIVPAGKLAGSMGTDAASTGMTVVPALEIFTASAMVQEGQPWGDVQKIDYSLQPPTNGNPGAGQSLMRGVTRNLLALNTELPQQQTLLENVSTLQFSFYDGTNWNDTWSTTLSNIPVAIRVSIVLADKDEPRAAQSPIKFVVPVVVWDSTNSITNQLSN